MRFSFVRYYKIMYRSLLLSAAFIFFSVALPCVCAGGEMSFVIGDSSCVSSSFLHEQSLSESGNMGCMNVLDHVASWRAFLSSSLPALLVFLSAILFTVFVSRLWYAPVLRIFDFRREIFHPPEYFDERILLSRSLFRAFYTGVLHTKISQ